jgi:hypothetical protein
MKKSTGIVFLIAAALAAFVYFYEMKHPSSDEASTADTSKPVYSVASTDVTALQIDRASTSTAFEHRADGWYITKPIATKAEATVLDAITSGLSSVRVSRTFPATPDNLKSFGLNDPAVTIDFTAKGAQHKLQLGGRDFSGSSVYALVDGGKDVSLLSDTILTSSDKNLDDFRDHTVLPGAITDATSFDLTNQSGEISAVKDGMNWKIEKPHAADADGSTILTLLGVLSSGQIAHFVADSDKDLGKYGLGSPSITFRAKLPDGKTAELLIGKKEVDEYDARDPSRPMVFRINEALHKNLVSSFFDLRDKTLTHLSDTDISHAELHNSFGTTTCSQNSGGALMLDLPAGQKGTAPECPAFVFAVESARATEIFDTPPADISAKLAKPAAQVTFTPKSGPKAEFSFSAAAGDSVYARTSAGPTIYKLDKKVLDDLNAKPPDSSAK